MNDWLLPQYLQDIIPPQSHILESWRRTLLDLYMANGYQLVITPIEEFQNSLAMAGYDLDTKMIKTVDRESGKTIGLRPDITPQVARIDAHIFEGKDIVRLCYYDRVLHSYPTHPFGSREPINIGAEIFGMDLINADVESIILLNQSIEALNIFDHNIEIHHMGLIRELLACVNKNLISPIRETDWLNALKIKSYNQIKDLLIKAPKKIQQQIMNLLDLYGDSQIIEKAYQLLPMNDKITNILQELTKVVNYTKIENPNINITFDLADARGYKYHSGLMYAVYIPNWANAIAYGGRYDGFGDRFGENLENRAATGFTIDLTAAQSYVKSQNIDNKNVNYIRRVFADQKIWQDIDGRQFINKLRSQKVAVIVGDQSSLDNIEIKNNCKEKIIKDNNQHIIVSINQ